LLGVSSPEREGDTDRREARLLGLAFAFLLLGASGLAISPAVRTGSWREALTRWQAFTVLPIWAALAWLLHRILCLRRPERDPLLLPIGMLLAGWGAMIVWRLAPAFGARQTGWLLVAGVCCLEVLRAPANLAWLRRYRYLWLGAGLALMAATLVFGTNPSGGEPRLWLHLGGIYFQPSEPMRLLLVAYLASYLADHPPTGRGLRSLLPVLAPLLVMWGLSVGLLLVQRDLGTGTLFLVLLSVLLYLASGRWQVLVAGLALVLIGGGIGYMLFDVVRIRLEAWINPWVDPTGRSYQIVQSLIAIASGGVFGRGPGLGSPRFVPVAHSDFIFSAVAEEWGLLGALAIIALFAVLVVRALRLAAGQSDPFAVFLGAGVGAAFGLQAALIVGGVMRLLPMTGVTLPFVSYGGSSLLTSFIGLGILLKLPQRAARPGAYAAPLRVLAIGSLLVTLALSLTLGWWSLVRAPALVGRLDNPRHALAGVYVPRGRILDRSGRVLAESVGQPGEYLRAYAGEASGPVIGYDSIRFGQSGLEAELDPILRGEVGRGALEVWWSELVTGFPPQGQDVRLTLDGEAQQAAVTAMEGRRGAVVILDSVSGEILVAASSPTFDGNRLAQDWETLVARSDGPLVDRATRSAYQPGSALAPLVAAWAERAGVARLEQEQVGASAPLVADGRVVHCRVFTAEDESIDLAEALRRGCPAPIAALGEKLGDEELAAMMAAFGLAGQPALASQAADGEGEPIDLVLDAGLAAAGQNGLVVTPLQVARAFAAIAAGGRLPPLRLIDAVQNPAGEWEPSSLGDGSRSAVDAVAAGRVLRALGPDDLSPVGFLAQAVVGPETAQVMWFIGISAGPSPARIVVVVLEDGGPAQARQIGSYLLEVAAAMPLSDQ